MSPKQLALLSFCVTPWLCTAQAIEPIDIRTSATLRVTQFNKLFGAQSVNVWVYCLMSANGTAFTGPGSCATPTFPSPPLAIAAGLTSAITLTGGGTAMPNEPVPTVSNNAVAGYRGHTLHFHGLDTPNLFPNTLIPGLDGVPETGATRVITTTDAVTYPINVDNRYIGGHSYHCHVHMVKHLEMGMYGALLVREWDTAGQVIKSINAGGPFYDVESVLLLSTLDPTYHTAQAFGDLATLPASSRRIFSTYNPQYFLINGNQGLSRTAPAETITASVGNSLAIRLLGKHSVNASFQILNAANQAQAFVLHNRDGWKQAIPETLTSLEISPGQSRDILITLPSSPGTLYPEVTYRHLEDDSPLATVYTALVFN